MAPTLLFLSTIQAHASEQKSNDNSGFLIGAGMFSAASSDCSVCDYSGQFIEAGYDFNHIVGVELKYASGDDDQTDLDINYFGANIGHDFNTGWFRLYGKVGYASIKEQQVGYSYCDKYSCYHPKEFSNSGLTFGVGTRFGLSGQASGLYLKLETMAVAFKNDAAGLAVIAGVGYRF